MQGGNSRLSDTTSGDHHTMKAAIWLVVTISAASLTAVVRAQDAPKIAFDPSDRLVITGTVGATPLSGTLFITVNDPQTKAIRVVSKELRPADRRSSIEIDSIPDITVRGALPARIWRLLSAEQQGPCDSRLVWRSHRIYDSADAICHTRDMHSIRSKDFHMRSLQSSVKSYR